MTEVGLNEVSLHLNIEISRTYLSRVEKQIKAAAKNGKSFDQIHTFQGRPKKKKKRAAGFGKVNPISWQRRILGPRTSVFTRLEKIALFRSEVI